MKLKNAILFDPNFPGALKRLMGKELPSAISLQLVDTFKTLGDRERSVFEVRDKLVERCGTRTESGVQYKSPEDQVTFEKEMQDLLDIEFEVPLKEKLKLAPNIMISGDDILALESIIQR